MKQIKAALRLYRQHWQQYLLVQMGLDLFNQFLLLPFFGLIMSFLLPKIALPFVSWLNVRLITAHQPFLFFLLLLAFIIFIGLFYLEGSLLALSLSSIQHGKWSLAKMNKLNFSPSVWFLSLLHFLTSLPLLILIFRTPLFAQIKLPEFILDYGLRSFWLGCSLLLLYLLLFWLLWRLLLAWPLLVFRRCNGREALRLSWRLTSIKPLRRELLKLLLLGLKIAAGLILFYSLLFLGQKLADLFPGKWPQFWAMANLLLLQLGAELGLSCWLTSACLNLFDLVAKKKGERLKTAAIKKQRLWPLLAAVLLVLFIGLTGKENYSSLRLQPTRPPLTIAHRGVDRENSVPNTIAALRKIHREKPDLVEMDVHETKDEQFIVFHDENLQQLAGFAQEPSQLTLKELTRLRLQANGHHAKLASFAAYLKAATALHQKLLVEIKTTPHDSANSMKLFNAKYGRQLLQNHDQVQSLDYRAVKKLRRLNPRLTVFYLQPYNFMLPHSQANGYAMEYSTVNGDFIRRAHATHRPVYVWTVNDVHLMRKMISEHVDGIITDRLAILKRVIREEQAKPSYAELLMNYAFVLPTKFDLTA